MAESKVQQPQWIRPVPKQPEPVLKIYNSLTRTKNEFIPINGRRVDWYNCGPTVYDAAHLGHARNYLTQDIIRRILRDYFGYEVNFVMNVTDIDDKIIARARELHLLNNYRSADTSSPPSASLKSDVQAAWLAYFRSKVCKCLSESEVPKEGEEEQTVVALNERYNGGKEVDAQWLKTIRLADEKFGLYLTSLISTKAGLAAAKDSTELIDSAQTILGWWLDKRDGHSVNDHSIFRSLSTFWENDFFNDMNRLRVLPPDTITRVSAYVPEIVKFVEKIVENGFAYVTASTGDVWFDVAAFEGAKGKGKGKEREDHAWEHVYAKLAPWSKGNRRLLEEGEGSLTTTEGKRSPADFALWKSAKPGEPTWPSPWGNGRPGWHIECSVMASEILGENMDIHSGGVDLMFPHHDNEIAQAEAYHDCRQWVNYFIHTGHLHIAGLKMSKSLKNFITIGEALETYSPRQLRLAFLIHLWNAKMDLKTGTRSEVENIEEGFNNFFRNVKAKMAEAQNDVTPATSQNHYEEPERQLTASLHQAQYDFRTALCDSFNTPDAISVLTSLVGSSNAYLSTRPRPKNIDPLRIVAEWLTRMLRMLGLGEGTAVNQEGAIGWGEVSADSDSAVDRDAILMPYLRALSIFRDDVRKMALSASSQQDALKTLPKELLELCDRLRDNELIDLGVALDDQEDGKALVKLAPAEELKRARDEKRVLAEVKLARKAAAAQAEEERRLAKLDKAKLSPSDMFRPPHVEEGLYGAWDDQGVPTHDAQGVELSKGKTKKLKKEWDGQTKVHDERKKIVEAGKV